MSSSARGPGQDRAILALRRYLAMRIGPLALLLLLVVSVSAPVAYLAVGTDTVRERADATAEQLAHSVRGAIQQRPLLWRYDVSKVAASLEVHRAHPEIRRIELVDQRGQRIDLGFDWDDAEQATLWTMAPVEVDGELVAQVWVGASARDVENRARLLLVAFALLGGALAGLIYWLPIRAMGVAEQRVVDLVERLKTSQDALATLNVSLEDQVAQRSTELHDALVEVSDKERRLRELSAKTVTIEEAERRALSRELHDSAGQTMTAIRINAQLMAAQASEGTALRTMAEKNVELIDTTLEEIRRIVDRLAPAVLDDLGLRGAVERLCEDFTERYGVPIEVEIAGFGPLARASSRFPGVGEDVGSGVEKAVYRLVQESLTNVARYARASRVQLRLNRRGDEVEIFIQDDGVGFDLEEARKRGRRGLAGMSERVELLGGELEMRSQPGEGTRIRVTLSVAPDPSQPESFVDGLDES